MTNHTGVRDRVMADPVSGGASRPTIPVGPAARDAMLTLAHPAVRALDEAEVLIRECVGQVDDEDPYPSDRWHRLLSHFERPDYVTAVVEQWALTCGLLEHTQIQLDLGPADRADRKAAQQLRRWLTRSWPSPPVAVSVRRSGPRREIRVRLRLENGESPSHPIPIKSTGKPGVAALHYFAADFLAAEAARLETLASRHAESLADQSEHVLALTDRVRAVSSSILQEAPPQGAQPLADLATFAWPAAAAPSEP